MAGNPAATDLAEREDRLRIVDARDAERRQVRTGGSLDELHVVRAAHDHEIVAAASCQEFTQAARSAAGDLDGPEAVIPPARSRALGCFIDGDEVTERLERAH